MKNPTKFGIIKYLVLIVLRFSCTVYCLNQWPSHTFSARSKKGSFVGYSETAKNFHVYFLSRIITSGSVKFFEKYSIIIKK